MNNEIILTTKKVGEISGKFRVPSYQRGYRWESTKVTRLLDDIYQSGDQDYCLQPVVVRRQGEQYELIDGQQRLTTLYLIYRYLRDINPFFAEPSFSLSYETREKSAGFLHTIDLSRRDETSFRRRNMAFTSSALVSGILPMFSRVKREMASSLSPTSYHMI